jgi:hypothetical protein
LFKEDTVFVVGAGASAEYGLPVGTDLAITIARLMRFEINCGHVQNGDPYIHRVFQYKSDRDPNIITEYQDTARRISEGITHAGSIDEYLDKHGNDEMAVFCGKAAIVKAILEAEKKSNLYYEHSDPRMINFNKLKDHWMKPFFKQLTDRRRKSDLDQIFSGITIICFNYDRCIEHYLIHALQKLYSITPQEAARLVGFLEIYYPYGKVGKLKTVSGQSSGVAFGAELGLNEFIQTVQGIRTYTEQVEDEGSLTRIKLAITNAKAIVFLGFAYHSQNMELLGSAFDKRGQVNAIFGTAFKMSDHNAIEAGRLAKRLAAEGYPSTLEINNKLQCNTFLEHYQMSL